MMADLVYEPRRDRARALGAVALVVTGCVLLASPRATPTRAPSRCA